MRMINSFVVAALAIGCGNGGNGMMSPPPDGGPRGNPSRFTFEAIEARSFLSFGWSGLIHNLRVPERTPFTVGVTSCDKEDGTGVCNFAGPIEPKGAAVNRRRCLAHMRQVCNADIDCGAATVPFNINRCVYIYDPPASSPLNGAVDATHPLGKVGACGWSFIPIAPAGANPSISGTIDMTSGELNLSNLTITLAQNGISGSYRGACGECMGDKVPNDGKAEGTCQLATHGEAQDPTVDVGMPCDTNRTGSIPGFEGDTSMDCSPTYRLQDGPGVAFGGAFTSSGYQVTISGASPDCTDGNFPGDPDHPGNKCFCGICSPDTQQRGCMSNADCPQGATCGGVNSTLCDPNPPPFNIDGTPNANNNPMIPIAACRNTTDLSVKGLAATRGNLCVGGRCNWDAEAGTGTCPSLLNPQQRIGCYPSGLNATVASLGGSRKQGSVIIADTANARCTKIQTVPAVNGQLGLPGLTFQRRGFRIIPEYGQ